MKPELQNKDTIAYLEEECKRRASEMADDFQESADIFASLHSINGFQLMIRFDTTYHFVDPAKMACKRPVCDCSVPRPNSSLSLGHFWQVIQENVLK